ncbi:HNH endonuclease [Rhodopseudomonas sp. B29]|uniref:HNH endonuclease n=1 Tax=Rhodopseudomonas sp. B29 TaxID=95607 RepID=UPI00190195BB|nr:HNH endonuclease [Rhodopseudomonas sp. B29]
MNVGQVEALTLVDGKIRMMLVGNALAEGSSLLNIVSSSYKSIRSQHCAFEGNVEEFLSIVESISGKHESYLIEASTTKSGKPRKGSPHSVHHSSDLIVLLERLYSQEPTEKLGASEHELQPSEAQTFLEGAPRSTFVNIYERDPNARRRCIAHWGLRCRVCRFDFEATYGRLGHGYIHVHHLKPLNEIGEEYEVDPVKDMRPVCLNCHAMLHKSNSLSSIEELQALVLKNRRE